MKKPTGNKTKGRWAASLSLARMSTLCTYIERSFFFIIYNISKYIVHINIETLTLFLSKYFILKNGTSLFFIILYYNISLLPVNFAEKSHHIIPFFFCIYKCKYGLTQLYNFFQMQKRSNVKICI